MLVLSRRAGDQVLIPSLGITLEVLSIKGNVIKLGISAPQEVRVLRGELVERLAVDRTATAQGAAVPPVPRNSRIKTEKPIAVSPLSSYLDKGRRNDKRQTSSSIPDSDVDNALMGDASDACLRESSAVYEVCF